jgi:hypothetical protein
MHDWLLGSPFPLSQSDMSGLVFERLREWLYRYPALPLVSDMPKVQPYFRFWPSGHRLVG